MNLSNSIVIELAQNLGFNLIGFSKYKKNEKAVENLKNWLSNGYHAKMSYMERNLDKKEDVSLILPSAKSIISFGINYYNKSDLNAKPNIGIFSKYASNIDYHLVIEERLTSLISNIKTQFPDFEAKMYVDSGPVMDKIWGVSSGLGWYGKHSNIINKNIGSWFFIANIICNAEFDIYSEPVMDLCGTCTKCIDACPTNAIVKPYIVDANKCISYLTIENKEEISEEFKGKFNNRVFGCDICQDVCPWNIKFALETNEPEFIGQNEIDLSEIENLTEDEFRIKYKRSPIKRTKLKGLQRNARFLK